MIADRTSSPHRRTASAGPDPPTNDRAAPPGQHRRREELSVAGTTEPGSTITVNGRIVVITPEGAFIDSFSAAPGRPITVVARDRAGNRDDAKAHGHAQQVTQIVGLTVTVTLDKTSARPVRCFRDRVRGRTTGPPRAVCTIVGRRRSIGTAGDRWHRHGRGSRLSHRRQRGDDGLSAASSGRAHSPSRVRFRYSRERERRQPRPLLPARRHRARLYGVRLVGEGLQRAAGTRLRTFSPTLTGNRIKSLLVGQV